MCLPCDPQSCDHWATSTHSAAAAANGGLLLLLYIGLLRGQPMGPLCVVSRGSRAQRIRSLNMPLLRIHGDLPGRSP